MTTRTKYAPLLAFLIALPISVLLLALSETLQIPKEAYESQRWLGLGMMRHILVSGMPALIPTSMILVAVGLTLVLPFRNTYVEHATRLLCTVGLSYQSYAVLGTYQPFRFYPPVIAAFVMLSIVLSIAYKLMASTDKTKGRITHKLQLGLPIISLMGATLLHVVNYRVFKGLYPSLHLCAVYLTFILSHLAAAGLVLFFWPRSRQIRIIAASGLVLIPAGIMAASLLASPKIISVSEPLYRSFSTLALSEVVGKNYEMSTEDKMAIDVPPDDDAKTRFFEHARFPKLSDDFRLEDYNVIFITVEALRFDQTSLGNPQLGNTPNLERFAGMGATVFTRAYSPSSGTVHTLAALMAMTYPSFAPMETWGRAWHGAILDEAVTVAELFRDSGYETLRISHNFYGCFQNRMLGFGQGFTHSSFVDEWKHDQDTDRKLTDIFLRALGARVESDKRFFSWLFFSSPHMRYRIHYPQMPGKTKLDRYRQEVRYVDEQFGRILDSLEQTDLLERTIIILTADHGEEFKEHGGYYHKSTVYSEVTHVPLVLWIPGVKGSTLENPVSTIYTFPYLMLHGQEIFKSRAENVLRNEIGPMLRATDGAVIIELVGHDRMLASLVYANEKVNYDFLTGHVEIYDLAQDPGEKHNLLYTQPGKIQPYIELTRRYREVRAAKKRVRLMPEKTRVPIPKNKRRLPPAEIPPPTE